MRRWYQQQYREGLPPAGMVNPFLSVHTYLVAPLQCSAAETRRKLSQEAASFMARKAEKLLLVENNQSHKEEVVISWVMELQWEVCLQNYSEI